MLVTAHPPRASRLLMCSTREGKHVLRRTTHHRVFHRRFRQSVSRLITRLTRVGADMARTGQRDSRLASGLRRERREESNRGHEE